MEDLSLMALLQCPGCLQQLDSSAKVLPCQHTFCKPCLQRQEPVQSQLLCPECQAPAHAQTAEELPTNLMLVRLLEGLQITQGPANTTLTPHYNVPSSLSQHRPEDTEGTQSDSSGSRDKYGQSEVSPARLTVMWTTSQRQGPKQKSALLAPVKFHLLWLFLFLVSGGYPHVHQTSGRTLD
uniref:RING-type domain-containing protein n=1 Tax=Periophthalmus magnuspinnatus TaxID=409849 RepID=A0A3B4ARV0_9GOBI